MHIFWVTLWMPVKKWSEVAQSCPTVWDTMDCSLPHSSIHGIFQARVLEWVAISFSRGSSQPRDRTQVSHIVSKTLYRLSHQGIPKSCPTLATPWTVACQAPLSMGVSRQDYQTGCRFLLQGIFQTQKSNPGLLHCRWILYRLSYGICFFIKWRYWDPKGPI